MMKKLALFFSVFFSFFPFDQATEAAAAPYYQGKTISILVGFSPGGGYDRMARILAAHLPNYIPGKPSVIVQNMPGASGLLAANYLYKIAKPDGLTIGTFERGIILAQLLKVEGVKFDMRKFAWVGSTAVESTVLVLRNDLPFKNFSDVLHSKTPVNLGGTGPGDASIRLAILLQEFVGLKIKMIFYPSSSEQMLAIERKEIDGRCGSYSALKPYIEKRSLVRPFIRGRVSEPGIENLPVDEDQVRDPKSKTIMALRSAPGQVGRPYVAAPGTPAPVMKILRDAFAQVAKDPEVIDQATKADMTIQYTNDEQCLKVTNFILNQPESMVKDISKYLKF
jgi:tripartite-type tricarboxylate transporter receptor subunit TctC